MLISNCIASIHLHFSLASMGDTKKVSKSITEETKPVQNSPTKSTKKNFKLPIIIISAVAFLCLFLTCCIGLVAMLSGGSSNNLGKVDYQETSTSMVVESEKYGGFAKNQVMVMLKDGASRSDAEKIAKSVKGEVVGEFEFLDVYQIERKIENQDHLEKVITDLEKNSLVESAGPNGVVMSKNIEGKSCTIFEDMYTVGDNAKHYKWIGMENAWKYINASGVKLNKVKVGVTDSGLNTTSDELNGNVKIKAISGDDVNNVPDVDSKGVIDTGGYNHGTAVTTMIGGDWKNGGTIGVAGGLEENLEIAVSNLEAGGPSAQYVPSKDRKEGDLTIDSWGYRVKTFAKIIEQIEGGASIINYSWGSEKPGTQNNFDNKIYKKFLNKVAKKYPKVLFVAAAGNEGDLGVALDGSNYDMGGTKAPNLITVGAINNNGDRAWFSNTVTGDGEISLVAVGDQVPVVIGKDGKEVKLNGTSFATPQVTSAAALLRSINPDLTAAEIKNILVKSAVTEVADPTVGDRIKAIDPSAGGPLMRVDKAVLSVLKNHPDFKKYSGLDEVSLIQKLNNFSKINATAVQDAEDPLSFKIIANIPEVKLGGTDVEIEMNGAGLIGGTYKKKISSAGNLEWGFSFFEPEDTAQLKLTRLDSNACTKLALRPGGIQIGKYKGQITFHDPDWPNSSPGDNIKINIISEIHQDNSIDSTVSLEDQFSLTREGLTFTGSADLKGVGNGSYNEEAKSAEISGTFSVHQVMIYPPKIVEAYGKSSDSFDATGTYNVTGTFDDVGRFEGSGTLKDDSYSEIKQVNFWMEKI